MVNADQTIPDILYRKMRPDYANNFVNNGEILFRPLTYYRKLEGLKGDSMEGRNVILDTPLHVEFKGNNGSWSRIQINGGGSKFEVGLSRPECCFISCYSMSNIKKYQYDDVTVEIFDTQKYISDLEVKLGFKNRASECKIDLLYEKVQYYDKVAPQNIEAWKWKRECYADECEFRLVFFFEERHMRCFTEPVDGAYNSIPEDEIRLEVGSLTHLARIVP
jgi:hypothetical protein